MINKIYDKSDYIVMSLLLAVMAAVPLSHYICLRKLYYNGVIANTIYVCAAVCFAVVATLISGKRNTINLSGYEKLFVTMMLCQMISCVKATDVKTAINGEAGRNEGILMLFSYYIFFYTARLLTTEKSRKLLMAGYLVIMSLHAGYGLMQFYAVDCYIVIDYYFYAISGVAGNPNFMGSLMVMACGVAAGLATGSKNIFVRLVCGALFVLYAVTLVFTKTMSGYLGLAMIFAVGAIRMLYQLWRRKGTKTLAVTTVCLLVSAAVLLVIADKKLYGIISYEINKVFTQIKYIAETGIIDENFASGRLLIWKNIFEMLPQYLLNGVGIDCLKAPYRRRYGLMFNRYVDKAHNELIQVLITMGLPVFLCYISIYFFAFKDLLKRLKQRTWLTTDMALLFVFAGYMRQAMFNISVIDVAPYFWIFLGMCSAPIIKTEVTEV